MCGISGIVALESGARIDVNLLVRMTDSIRHRGPDDEGYLLLQDSDGSPRLYSGPDSTAFIKGQYPSLGLNTATGLGMGFRRLGIIDPGPGGHQPMYLPEADLAITFNGEIYNYLELRQELEASGYSFRSSSDTEVILAAYRHWGESCLEHFNGIWAFAIWDGKQRQLFLARDRFGVKPLYYASNGSFFYWASEIKQLLLCPIDLKLNHPMIDRSLKVNSLLVYEDETNWQSINALVPGHRLIIKDGRADSQAYYKLDPDTFESSTLSFEAATLRYRELFEDSLALQLRSDVEVAASLSGGLDSSAIVCSSYAQTQRSMRTFSSYYESDPALDERKWIGLVADSAKANPSYVSPDAGDAIKLLDTVTYFNDLPTRAGYVSQWAVMEAAHKAGIKVMLSGQGSDELLAGYRHAAYRYLADILRTKSPKAFTKELAAYYKGKPLSQSIPGLGKSLLSAILPESALYSLEYKYYRFEPFNRDFLASCRSSEAGALEKIRDIKGSRLSNFLFNMLHSTSIQTLLHLEDRMSGANSVESRVPFLDHRLVEFCFSLPSSFKIMPPMHKYIHREAMRPLVPPEIYSRQDKGIFSSPFYSLWMRTGMRQYISEVFHSESFRRRGIWNLERIYSKWQSYQSGSNKDAEMLFNILATEIWFRIHVDQ